MMKTLHLAIFLSLAVLIVGSSATYAQNVTNSTPPIPYSILRSASPTLTPYETQSLINVALAIPGLQQWSHDWRYIGMGFLGNNKLATGGFEWQYATLNLKAPPSSAPISCDNDWWAWVEIDMTTMKVVQATYPTMESHSCQVMTGGGPTLGGSEGGSAELSSNTTSNESPLKQFKSGIPISNIQCAQDLSLVIKAEDGTPACINQDSISKLILRGWISTISSLGQNNTIFGDFYQGIENDSGIVSIKNQTYYMMTASNITYPIASGMTVKFHNVTFSFPYGSQATPGGVIIPFDMTFPDGTTEAYGNVTKNPDGSGSISGISLGPGPSANRTVTVQSDHIHPQADVTLTEDQIKLLVSTENQNDTVTTTIGNQTYYFTTLNDTLSSYHGVGAIPFTFHDVNFTLFPSAFSVGPPSNLTLSCGNTNFSSEVKFTDETYEKLSVQIPGSPCVENYTETTLTSHLNPQAGVQDYHGKIRLLVSTAVNFTGS